MSFGIYEVDRSDDLCSYDTPMLKVCGSGPGCQSGYRSGDL